MRFRMACDKIVLTRLDVDPNVIIELYTNISIETPDRITSTSYPMIDGSMLYQMSQPSQIGQVWTVSAKISDSNINTIRTWLFNRTLITLEEYQNDILYTHGTGRIKDPFDVSWGSIISTSEQTQGDPEAHHQTMLTFITETITLIRRQTPIYTPV